MGKTFRREKSFTPKAGKLHTHRDLPDIQEGLYDDDDLSLDDEDYFYGELHTKKQTMVRREDESSGKVDKG
jgi:hypothetical protein